jgi:hypothetical protein
MKAYILVILLITAFTLYFITTPGTALDLSMPTFTDMAPSLGINVIASGYGSNPMDYDGDGRLDLLFLNHLKDLTLFQQQPDGSVVDVAATTGIEFNGDDHGAAWGDCDNDERLDLYIARGNFQANLLYRNLGNNTFLNIAVEAGVGDTGRGRGSSWVDYNNDGKLDIFMTNGYDEGSSDKLYRNEGNCVFTDVTSQAGDIGLRFHKYGVSWADYDNDGDMDVFTASGSKLDFDPQGLDMNVNFYRNNGDGTFTDVTESAGIISEPTNSMAWGDYNNDGYMDLFTAVSYYTASNRLYLNNGNGTFSEVAQSAGVSQKMASEDAVWGDFNNDGYLDLYVANAGNQRTGDEPNFLYLNNKDRTFTDVALTSGIVGSMEGLSGGTAVTDYNGDGFLDIVITHGLSTASLPGPHELFINSGNEGNWLQIKLQGIESNYLGIGARVEVTAETGLKMVRQMNGGVHHYSQDEMLVSFGLGDSSVAKIITIYWPSGITQSLTNVPVNQRLTIIEDTGVPIPTATPSPAPTPTSTPSPVEIIVDNLDNSFSTIGYWGLYSGTKYPSYNLGFRYTPSGIGNRQATFRPDLPVEGNYEVYIWFFTTAQSATNSLFQINYNGGSSTVYVNRYAPSIGGGYWYSLGIYNFLSGTSGYVMLSNNADGKVDADAILFSLR